jgi:hypothetical protein
MLFSTSYRESGLSYTFSFAVLGIVVFYQIFRQNFESQILVYKAGVKVDHSSSFSNVAAYSLSPQLIYKTKLVDSV